MKLYFNQLSPNCRKVHAIIANTGASVEQHNVDLMQGEQKKPEFLALNPNGMVPVLVDGDLKLWESNAIICYLADITDSTLWPKSKQRYDILRWMFWESNHFSTAIGKILGEVIFKPMRGAEPDKAIIEIGLTDFRQFAAVLDGQLKTTRYVCGDAPTLADFSIAVWLGYAQLCELPVVEFSHVDKWLAKMSKVAGYKELAPPSMG